VTDLRFRASPRLRTDLIWFNDGGRSMSMVELPRAIPDQPGRPVWGEAARPMRELTRAISLDRDAWTPERRAQITSLFDSSASGWRDRDVPERHDALVDALTRGGPFPGGWCVEVGSGTGNATADLQQAFRDVVSLDLSREMLRFASFRVVRSNPMPQLYRCAPVRRPLSRSSTCSCFRPRSRAFWRTTACCCGSARMARRRPSTSRPRTC
jgi:Methyltransferase domain